MLRNVVVLLVLCCVSAFTHAANVFNMPTGQTSLEFVTIGDPGNAPDTRYINTYPSRPGMLLGSVPYEYQIGKYDVTLAQYTLFLNAVAKLDNYSVYDTRYNLASGYGISRTGLSGNYTYTVNSGFENHPVIVNWNNAARFVNWLQNGQPTGPQGPMTTESGVYELYTVGPFTLNGNEVTRNANSTYYIPTENEWYKAAYYKGGGANAGYWTYATQSDVTPSNVISATGTNNANYHAGGTTPVGTFYSSPSYYGTFDQSGNLWNWTETPLEFSRVTRGGDINSIDAFEISSAIYNPISATSSSSAGFRVASIAPIPEPSSTLVVLGLLAVGLGVMRLRRR